MHIVLFAHPEFTTSQSMPRFARMLQKAYQARGHQVQIWAPKSQLHGWFKGPLAKWAGYVDQYLLFPHRVKRQLAACPPNTLFVLTDQALGPWVPLLKGRPLVVHVHDLLALRSALGEVPQNPTRWSGRVYQHYIRRGFAQAEHFLCISNRTREELLRVGRVQPTTCDVVHNGLNQKFYPLPLAEARSLVRKAGLPMPEQGVLLHISGNQWYKNVVGVVRLYTEYARATPNPLPLWLVGVRPDDAVQVALEQVPDEGTVHFLYGIEHTLLLAVYTLSRAFLFPSLAEGFGWPIVEAQACGCPVLTTDDAPMNEIGGPETTYLPLLQPGADPTIWAQEGARALQKVLDVPAEEAERRSQACIAWAKRFESTVAIDRYLSVYARVLQSSFKTTAQATVQGN